MTAHPSDRSTERRGLVQLTYVSTRARHVTDDEVVELALRANRRNRELDITGCLWFGVGRFFQVLEGPREAVERLYASIVADSRHQDVQLLSFRPIEQRIFARWGLAHVPQQVDQTIADEVKRYAGVTWRPPLQTPPQEPGTLQSLLNRLLSVLVRRESENSPAQA